MKRFIYAVTVLFVLGAGAAFAQDNNNDTDNCPTCGDEAMESPHEEMMEHMGKGMGMGWVEGIAQLRQQLKLSQDQVDKVDKIRSDYMKSSIKTMADKKTARIDLMDALKAKSPDFKTAREKAKQIGDLSTKLKTDMIDAYEKAYGVLNKDQKDKLPQALQQFRDTMQQHRMQRRGMMRGMMGGTTAQQ